MLRHIKDANVDEKRVLVRVDYNVPMDKGVITDESRISQSLDTILHLIKRRCKVILVSHAGRPGGRAMFEYSLKPMADKLANLLPSIKVHFVGDCIGNNVKVAIDCAEPGEIVLLENLRFDVREESCDPEFAKELASLADFYVNDAFSVSHRKHASVGALAELLPSAAGFSLCKEIDGIDDFLGMAVHPKTCIIGGAKVSTKLPLIRNILPKVDKLILGGGIAVSFAIVANNMEIMDPFKSYEYAAEILELVKSKKIYIARDFSGLLYDEEISFDVNTKNKNTLALDLGPKSIADICDIISRSKTVLWNGPVGRFEDARFSRGTFEIAKHIASNTARNVIKSVVGGGDTVAALNQSGVGFRGASCVSTAGGAFLEYLEGRLLPGVEVLRV